MSGAAAAVEIDPPATPAASTAAAAPAPPAESLLANPDADNKSAPVEGDVKPAEAGQAESSLLSGDPEKPKDKADGPADAKPAEVPETYQFTLPEGMTLDEVTLAKATPIFKDLKLGQEGAQKLVSLYAETVKETTEANAAANDKLFTETKAKWRAESKAHPEFGGDKLAENLGQAKQFVQRFDPKGEAMAVLEEYGLANNPAVLALLYRASKTISEDKSISRGDGAPQQTPKKPWEIMYPDLARKE